MKTIDNTFSAHEISILRNLIGQNFENFICDPYTVNNWVYQVVGLTISSEKYCIENNLQTIDYFGADEDICFLEINTTTDFQSSLEGVTQITNPVNASIKEIQVIEEYQKLYNKKHLLYELKFVRGLVFVLYDEREIAFEKTDPFSEEIAISKGTALVNKFSPMDQPNDLDPGIRIVVSRGTLLIN